MNEPTREDGSFEQHQQRLMKRFLDPLVKGGPSTGVAWGLLAAGMFVSFVYCLWVTRGTTFSGDELSWVAFSPSMDLRVALEPHSGHLVLIPHSLYKLVLETIGPEYMVFRLLTLGSVFLATGLFFAYARKRVGNAIALAPCLVLLFFGSDSVHILQGNGFTIMFAVACGMAALLGLERRSRPGDIVACLALVLGVLTYTTALPFLAGALVLVLIGSDRWRRMWVVAIPIGVYLAWRVWLVAADVPVTRGGLDPVNILLLPAWTYQSLSGILSALTGVNYNFGGGSWLPPGEMAGPALALAFVVLIGWRMSKVRLGSWFWTAVAIALALFVSQVLAFIPTIREPGTPRYLYPGAFAVLLILVEAFRAYPMTRTRFIAIWLVALVGFATNVMYIQDSGDGLRERNARIEAEIRASTLVSSAVPYYPGANAVPLQELTSEAPIAIIGGAQRKYGGLAMPEEEIQAQPPEVRANVDRILSQAFGLALVPLDAPLPDDCEVVKAAPGESSVLVPDLPKSGVVLKSKSAGSVTLKRFDPAFSTSVGRLVPGQKTTLYIPADEGTTPWQLMAEVASLTVCGLA